MSGLRAHPPNDDPAAIHALAYCADWRSRYTATRRAEVAEWQTRRSQKPLGGNAHVGSTPTFGTNFDSVWGRLRLCRDPSWQRLTATVTATRTDKLGRVRTINACVLPLVREEQEGFVPLEGEYAPSTQEWVRNQVETYERTGGRAANTLLDTGLPIIIVTTRGKKTGKIRKTPLMRVEHEGEYALVASMGGAPKHPVWYRNLKADPTAVMIQDGPEPFDADVQELTGEEKARWWDRAVAAFPPYAQYQTRTERVIPVFVARRRG